MARIRHIAMCSDDQLGLAGFYQEAFGMIEVFRHFDDQKKIAVYLSDGEINLAIIPLIPTNGFRPGIDHFGFHIDDLARVSSAAIAAGAQAGPARVPQDGRQNEAYIRDPAGQRVDLAPAGWHLGAAGSARIRRIVLACDDPPQLARFYATVFGLHKVPSRPGDDSGIGLSDGYVNVALVPAAAAGSAEAGPHRTGLNAFGFHVDDVASTVQRACAHGGRSRDAGAVLLADTRLLDPAGTSIEISAEGWPR